MTNEIPASAIEFFRQGLAEAVGHPQEALITQHFGAAIEVFTNAEAFAVGLEALVQVWQCDLLIAKESKPKVDQETIDLAQGLASSMRRLFQ